LESPLNYPSTEKVSKNPMTNCKLYLHAQNPKIPYGIHNPLGVNWNLDPWIAFIFN
jgi:hypothetical protein